MNNLLCVLDEGEIKNLCYTITMSYDYKKCLVALTRERLDEEVMNSFGIYILNTKYKRPTESIRKFAKSPYLRGRETFPTVQEANRANLEVAEFYGVTKDEILLYCDLEESVLIPFTPSIMLNISPNWKGAYNLIPDDTDGLEPDELAEREYMVLENQRMEEALQYLVETYMRECNRFDYYDYVLEVGSEGNHLHAHIVGHVNPGLMKSVCGDATKGSTRTSHFGKGNHVQQLIKISKGIKGIKGYITRYGIQSSILRKDYLVNDKIDYLYEDKKPEGHKNLYVLWDSPKHVCV